MAWNANEPTMGNTIAADIPAIEENFQCLNDRFAYGELWIPASIMIPTTTNGAAAGTFEFTTNDLMVDYYAFDNTTEEYTSVNVVFPIDYDLGTINAKFYCSSATGSSAGDTVEWKISGTAIRNDYPLDHAQGTGQTAVATMLADNGADLQITGATGAITIGDTPNLGGMINLKFSRNVSGTDDMTEDAWLFGVLIQYGRTNAEVSAW